MDYIWNKDRILSQTLMPKTMNLLGSTKGKITKNENGGNLPHLVLCKIVNDDYQQDSRVLHTFVPKKLLGQLLYISPKQDYIP